MWARAVRVENAGLVVLPLLKRRGFTLSWGEILSAERRPSGRAFRLHVLAGEPVTVFVRHGRRRGVESRLRDAGVRVVDEYGATIDASQFVKEADPDFVPRSVREYDRSVRQWSDDG